MRGLTRNRIITVVAASIALAAAPPTASASTSAANTTIRMQWSTPDVTSQPCVGSSVGQTTEFPNIWSATGSAINDSGTIPAFKIKVADCTTPTFAAEGVLSDRILVDAAGNTITLRCNEFGHNLESYPSTMIPLAGSCTVLDGPSPYSGLLGHGALTAYTDLSDEQNAFVYETLTLSTP